MRYTTFLILAAALLGPEAASAHIVFAEPQATAGAYGAGFLRISHGCGASPTRSIRVEIPAGIVSARPQPKPGWSLRIEREPLNPPIKGEGGTPVTERVKAITWTGALPADQFDQFGIMMKLPADAGPLYFPTTQTCDRGRTAWVNIPPSPEQWHDTPDPAPLLMLRPAHAGHDIH